jgi:hypothetical protein
MWNIRIKVTPVIIGANGTVCKCFRRHRSNTPGKHEIREVGSSLVGHCIYRPTVGSADVKVQNSTWAVKLYVA